MKAQNKAKIPLADQICELQDRIYRLENELSVQKKNQDSIAISERNLSAILEQNADGIIIVNAEGIVLYVNPAAESLFNKKGEVLVGTLFGFPVSLDKSDTSIVIMTGKGFREVEFRVVQIQWKGHAAFQLSVRDITEHKQLVKEKEILTSKLKERIKELTCLSSISSIIEIYNTSLVEMFKEIVRIIPTGWQYPDITCARIVIGKNEYKTTNYKETKWKQSSNINTNGTISGFIDVCYLKEISGIDEGPFQKEEINLLNLIAARLGHVIDRKLAEQELKKAKEKAEEDEAKFRELFSSVADAIFIFNPDNLEILEANKATSALYGYSHDELIGMSAFKFSAEVEKSKTVAKLIKNKEQVNVPLRHHKKKDGTDLFVEVNTYNISVNGKNNYYSVIHDLTNIKKTETELLKAKEKSEESEARLRDAQRIANIGNWSLDLKTERVEMSDQMLALLGFKDKKEALEVSNHKKFYTPESWLRFEKALETIITTGKSYEIEMEFSDKNAKFRCAVARGEAIYGKSNKINGIKGTLQDITERKKLETSLIEREEFLNRTGEISKVGGWQLVDNFTRVEWTNTAGDIHELPEGVHPSLEDAINYYHPDDQDKVIKSVNNAIEKGKPYDFKTRLITAKGNLRWVRIIGRAEMKKGKIVRVSGAIQDFTEQKKIEQELIKAKDKAEESDRLKTAFLTNMSHEIRTPMNGILGFSELLKDPDLSNEDLQNFIQIIQISGARLLNTINDIVDLSQIEAGLIYIEIKETNINEIIEFTNNFFKPEAELKKLQLSFKNALKSNESIIKTDSEKVNGILTNLVKNAIKFTNEGSIELGYEKKGEYLEFFVQDTGMGVKQGQEKLIFKRFRQGSESNNRGYEGNGLGLSISKSYVNMLGGEIWVKSKEGSGSTFYFTIPYNPVSEEKNLIKNTISEKDNEVQHKKLNILIVEDDEMSHLLLSKILQNINCEVLHAIKGIEAVELCRENPELDLILMDIKMPGIDGYETTRQIRQFNKDVIIIAQTAHAFSDDKEKALEAGCNSYVTKPINKNKLTELVNSYFI